jgi:outer membrane protein OmpA-like peptidoglycan-associated protein
MRPAILLVLLTLGGAAFADPVEIDLKNQVPAGQKPSIVVKALDDVRRVRFELTREDDNKSFVAQHGPMRQGQQAALPFGDTRGGRAKWRGKMEIALASGNQFTNQFTFETGTIGDLKVGYKRERLDLDGHVLEFTMSRPAGRAELHVFADDGSEVGSGEATFHGEPAGTWLRVEWTQAAAKNVMRLELRAVAADGPAATVKLLPWAVRIPHEEVVFETGKWDVRPSEEAKLHASYQRIVDAVALARKADPSLNVRVFIAGHTDTVGAGGDNKRLSLERARAIGAWFRDHGLPLPIAYAGFGEDALKVQTPDNTDEERNRRADYIVGVEEPVVARGARAEWHPLK